MSFFEKFGEYAGKATNSAINGLNDYVSEVQKYMDLYDRYDSEELLKMSKRLSGHKQKACYMLLKQRKERGEL